MKLSIKFVRLKMPDFKKFHICNWLLQITSSGTRFPHLLSLDPFSPLRRAGLHHRNLWEVLYGTMPSCLEEINLIGASFSLVFAFPKNSKLLQCFHRAHNVWNLRSATYVPINFIWFPKLFYGENRHQYQELCSKSLMY